VGKTLLWILACASGLLLVYEGWTLIGSVLVPLLNNPQSLQTDFHYYYDAARRFSQDRSRLYLATDDVIAGFAYPPPAIVPFLTLARWPLGTAFLALTILSYVLMLLSIRQWLAHLRRLGHELDGPTTGCLLLIAGTLGPTYMNAVFGQVNTFVLASAVAFVTLASTSPFGAGVVLALGGWLKIYPALLAAMVIWDRKAWRAVGWAGAAGVAIVILLLPIVPLHAYGTFFLDVLAARFDKTAIHITNQSLVAFLERFHFSSDLFLNWTGQQAITVSGVIRAINLVVAGGAVFAVAKYSVSRESKAAALMALVAVIAPLGWGHTYVMVLPLVVLQLMAMKRAPTLTALAIFCCVSAFMIPAGRHLPIGRAPDWIENIVYSRYLLATLVLMWISAAWPVGQKTEPRLIASA
jgi:alpha-1,2-mannosyltransferase